MDALARLESARSRVEVHRLRAQRFEVHLDPPPGFVVERHVAETRVIEVEAKARVEVQQHVAIERAGDAQRIVVRGVEHSPGLLRVDPDEEPAAGPASALLPQRAQERERLHGRKVADARSRIEEGRRALVEHVVQRQAGGEVRDHADHLDLREVRRHASERALDLRARDVHRHVARRIQEGQPRERLAAIAGAQVHELRSLPYRLGDLGAVVTEDGDLRARGVVLGQAADRSIKRASQLVVEVLRRDAGRAGDERRDDALALARAVILQPAEDAVLHRLSVGHAVPPRAAGRSGEPRPRHSSRARRRPRIAPGPLRRR